MEKTAYRSHSEVRRPERNYNGGLNYANNDK